MVKVKIVAVGRTKQAWIKEAILHYRKLLCRYAQVELVEVKEEKITESRRAEAVLKVEAERILKHLNKSGAGSSKNLCVAMQVKGKQQNSEEFARMLCSKLNQGYDEFTFVVGGALGLSRRVTHACPVSLSLSRMTFTHQMSRVLLMEQIYRAFSILKGTGYHK